MAKIYIITGKGGVGKTSVAAAHAVRSAAEGKRTLLVSADMAHNIGDLFQVQVGRHATEVMERLSLLELDPYMLMREEYPNVNRSIASVSGSVGSAAAQAGDSYMIPGFENLFCLLKIRDLYLSGDYDRIIVDCAPTGETLSLLKLPELLSWYVEKFSPVGRMITRILTPVAKFRYRMTLPDSAAMDEIGKIHADLVRLEELLKDPDICRVRLVCIPEKMVVEETRRSYMYLNLYRYPVDTLFINRILPEKTGSSFMEHWRQIQTQYLKELESIFTGLTIERIPWFSTEIRGAEAVIRLCAPAIGGETLFDRPVRSDNEIYAPIEGGYSLTIKVPGAAREEVEVFPREMDVDIRINNYMRSIPLPGVLRGAKMTSRTLEDDRLTICFRVRDDV
ncbi:MAG: ArsA family ATPase [Eubacteriales bacterium]|nr:ArsA family ATPase [Eubacteriales bacterium]